LKSAAPEPGKGPPSGSHNEPAGATTCPEEAPVFPPIITTSRPYRFDSRHHATSRDIAARMAAGIARLVATAVRRHRARRATRRLMAFDDQLLRDIGVGRGEIERVVHRGRGS
jgi:uncharacterized protein YjiS (DUF1127 family)